MKLRWLIPLTILFPLQLHAAATDVGARVATVTINPNEITTLHLRPGFESTIHLPEEITSVILGSPGTFKAEHSEAEPEYVYVKPISKEPVQSNLLIATKSGQHVVLELVSDGGSASNATQPIDFLIEYRSAHSFLIGSDSVSASSDKPAEAGPVHTGTAARSALQIEFEQQARINAPQWTKWPGKQIETSIGDVRQWSNETAISYSIYNDSDKPVEIVPPQIQISGRKPKRRKKEGKGVTSDQLQIRDYRLSTTRLEPGARADGVVVFDRPNFKQSTERLFLQLAEADRIDQPILIRLPFTPPISGAEK